jgi:ABC-type multidrug transport system fused ATPase/permease subunit
MATVTLLGLQASKKVRCIESKSSHPFTWCVLISHILTSSTCSIPHQLFSELLDSTLKAPMSFFDTTPAGRIMNRFSKGKLPKLSTYQKRYRQTVNSLVHLFDMIDVYTLDEALPSSFRMYLNCMFQVMR